MTDPTRANIAPTLGDFHSTAGRARPVWARTAQALIFVLGTGISGATLTGCDPHAYSPPARFVPLETAQTPAAGGTSIAAAGKFASVVFGPEVVGGTVRVRRGLSDRLEGSVEASAVYVGNDGETDLHRGFYTGRLGTKYRLHEYVALAGGLGGGGSEAGGFAAPDVGVILAWENPYFVPWLSGRLAASLPFARRTLTIPYDGDRFTRQRVTSTFYATSQVGFRVPIALSDSQTLSILAGLELGYMADEVQDDGFGGMGVGVDYAF